MENSTGGVTVNLNNGVSKADLAQAKKKRMLLSEVYVHKTRKIDSDSNNEDEFEVFHIFEFADDPTMKITPKLSTNCTEPRKIIEVLQNSSGSDTPQLERLIDKLCTQNKKWADTQPNQTRRTPISTATAPSMAATTATANNAEMNKAGPTLQSYRGVNVPDLMQAASVNRPSPNLATITRVSIVSNDQTIPSKQYESQAMDIPIIRCRTIDSLKGENQPHDKNTSHQSVAKKRVTLQEPVKRLVPAAPKPQNVQASVQTYSSVGSQQSAKQPKLWNNVMQQKKMPPLEVLMTVSDSNGSVTQMQKQTLQIENATDNSSTLKINQVFEGVSENFGEIFLGEPQIETHGNNASPSPLLDDLVKEIESDKPPLEPYDIISLVKDTDERCADYRCNICLDFNDSYANYKEHMCKIHGFKIVCTKCHEGFLNIQRFTSHGTLSCQRAPNAKRPFICIVDPPIIIMRNQKVIGFRCKHCVHLAFENQRNYVTHAQRHAKLFRCKLCPTKLLTKPVMRQHLQHH